MSITAALAYRWDGKRARLYFQMKPDSYDGTSLIGFLKDLKKHFRGQPVILIWDGLPAHRSREMQEFLAAQQDWLYVARLPGYAPDLNPVEDLWGNLKGNELANQSADNLGEVGRAVETGMERVKQNGNLLFGFLTHTGLSL
jgi:putative transposase